MRIIKKLRHADGFSVSSEPKEKKFYNAWVSMKQRCLKPSSAMQGKYYKDIGVGIDTRWLDYLYFKQDMFASYLISVDTVGLKQTTLDRIDNKLGYSAANCRWATPKDQSRNRKSNQNITFDGMTMCLSDWAKKLNLKRQTLAYRLIRADWSIERAFALSPEAYRLSERRILDGYKNGHKYVNRSLVCT